MAGWDAFKLDFVEDGFIGRSGVMAAVLAFKLRLSSFIEKGRGILLFE